VEVAKRFGVDGALVVDAEVFAGKGTVNARSVGNGLAIALGEPTGCAVDSVQYFVDDGGRESWVDAVP
jgi:hypothetical protein